MPIRPGGINTTDAQKPTDGADKKRQEVRFGHKSVGGRGRQGAVILAGQNDDLYGRPDCVNQGGKVTAVESSRHIDVGQHEVDLDGASQ